MGKKWWLNQKDKNLKTNTSSLSYNWYIGLDNTFEFFKLNFFAIYTWWSIKKNLGKYKNEYD